MQDIAFLTKDYPSINLKDIISLGFTKENIYLPLPDLI
jgi:hypothetical protein